MDKESKSKKIRTSSSKEHRAKRKGRPLFQSESSQPKSIQQMIQQNDYNIKDMTSRISFLEAEMAQTIKTFKQGQSKEIIINSLKKQIQMIEEGILAALSNGSKLLIMWLAELNISDVTPELQQQIKKKTEKKKQNIASKMKAFTSEDQEQE